MTHDNQRTPAPMPSQKLASALNDFLHQSRENVQTSQATQPAGVTDEQIEQVLSLAHAYADAKMMRYGALGIEESPDPDEAFQKLRRAILALRPVQVPMTPTERERELDRSPVDGSWDAGDAFMEGIYAAEAHHGITAAPTASDA